MMSKTFQKCIPFFTLFILLGLLGWELFYSKPNELPSALIGEEVPHFVLPNLLPHQPAFTHHNFAGRVSLLNIWATWCEACNLEHSMLMKIKNDYHIPIYGILYKDKVDDATAWLNEHGNPYILVGSDHKGDVAIDLGVYGTPETFVINAQGKILYRHVGILNQKIWDDVLYPLIKKAGA